MVTTEALEVGSQVRNLFICPLRHWLLFSGIKIRLLSSIPFLWTIFIARSPRLSAERRQWGRHLHTAESILAPEMVPQVPPGLIPERRQGWAGSRVPGKGDTGCSRFLTQSRDTTSGDTEWPGLGQCPGVWDKGKVSGYCWVEVPLGYLSGRFVDSGSGTYLEDTVFSLLEGSSDLPTVMPLNFQKVPPPLGLCQVPHELYSCCLCSQDPSCSERKAHLWHLKER